MSVQTKLIAVARHIKHAVNDRRVPPMSLSPVRRIERVALGERICAMTFDDGPCLLPPSAQPNDEGLTLCLLRTLESFGAKGTFDVVGDTSDNYPDIPGKSGTAAWGGICYDHYPDIERDALGGALHAPRVIDRILSGGHGLANHSYRHLLFGKKSVIYGKRAYLDGVGSVLEDLQKLHTLIRDTHGYEMTLSRPPHYVDRMPDGFSSYDAYTALGYQYMAASFDGGGWLPLSSYEEEVDAMLRPMERLLATNPDALSGQIIFQKDGFNMARRTPVADGLKRQLELLSHYGYRVVTVPELLELSSFADVPATDPCALAARHLVSRGYTPAYRDNTLRPDGLCTRVELYQMLYARDAVLRQVETRVRGKDPRPACTLAESNGLPTASESPLDSTTLCQAIRRRGGIPCAPGGQSLSRRDVLLTLADAL